MTGTSRWAWLVSGVLIVAACGGGDDDAGNDAGTAAPDTSTPIEADSDGAAPDSVAVEEPADSGDTDTDTDTDTGATDSPADLGPPLEPVATFVTPTSASPVGGGIAVSPSGDRVAVMWAAESDFATNLAVYDAATGSELATSADDRLEGDLFWAGDDRIITASNFGVLRAWDSATLEAISEEPLSNGAADCAGGNGVVFDPGAGALFMKSDGLCRIDIATGEAVLYGSETPTTLLAVAIGGNAVYLRGTDDTGGLVLRVLDATTLDVVSDEPAAGGNPVIAASAHGLIEQESGGFGYLVQPAGRVVDFYTSGVTTSAAGGYYVSGFDGGAVVINSSDGSTVGTIEPSDGSKPRTAWSADDTVLAALTADGVSVFRIG